MEGDDDDGFVGYIPSAINPGGGLTAGAALAVFVSYGIFLPLLLHCANQREARRKAAGLEFTFITTVSDGSVEAAIHNNNAPAAAHDDDNNDGKKGNGNGRGKGGATKQHRQQQQHGSSSRPEGNDNNGNRHQKKHCSEAAAAATLKDPYRNNTMMNDNNTDDDDDDDDRSIASQASSLGSAIASILDRAKVPRNKTQRKRLRIKEQQLLEMEDDMNNNKKAVKTTSTKVMTSDHGSATFTKWQGIDTDPADDPVFAPSPGGCGTDDGQDGGTREDENAKNKDLDVDMADFSATLPDHQKKVAGYTSSLTNTTAQQHHTPPTVTNIDHHHRGPTPTTTTTTTTTVRNRPDPADEFSDLGIWDKLATISAWDLELKRVIRLSTPYCTQALITGLTDTLNVAIIGNLIGTRELSAFVMVNMLVEFTSEFIGGFHEALATLCSQAIGANNKVMAGQYVQISTILYVAFFIPCMLLWAIYMAPVLRLFGFDEETVHMGQQYNYILIVDLLIDGVSESIHGLLDVGGQASFSTLIGAGEEIAATVALLLVALFTKPDLVTVGLIQFGIGMNFLILNVAIIYWRGWFLPYREGMFGSLAFSNGKAVWLVCKTASSLSFGMLLTDGEWEILTILASFMGPAEVAAWGIFGTIWDGIHELIDGFAAASEVRCAFLLGSGQPLRAKLSAYKSIMVGTFSALFITSGIYIAGDDLPTWLTKDPALQQILRDMLPLFGIANFVMALDTMSWTLLGSQGRYRLATIIVFLASWFVTLPLALLSSTLLNFNLEGQLFAFITGYLACGVIHAYFLLRSDWHELSKTVVKDNESEFLQVQEAPIPVSNMVAPEGGIEYSLEKAHSEVEV